MTSRVAQVASGVLAAFATAATIAASIESARSVAQLTWWGIATVASGMAVTAGCSLTSAARSKAADESHGAGGKHRPGLYPHMRVNTDNEDYQYPARHS